MACDSYRWSKISSKKVVTRAVSWFWHLANLIMGNTYTKIKLTVCPTPLHTIKSTCDVIPKLSRHAAHYVICCAWTNGCRAKTNLIWQIHPIQTSGRCYQNPIWSDQSIYGKSILLRTLYRWIERFNLGTEDTFDDHSAGWLETVTDGAKYPQTSTAVISELNAIPASEYQNALQMWLGRLEFCVASGWIHSEGF